MRSRLELRGIGLGVWDSCFEFGLGSGLRYKLETATSHTALYQSYLLGFARFSCCYYSRYNGLSSVQVYAKPQTLNFKSFEAFVLDEAPFVNFARMLGLGTIATVKEHLRGQRIVAFWGLYWGSPN